MWKEAFVKQRKEQPSQSEMTYNKIKGRYLSVYFASARNNHWKRREVERERERSMTVFKTIWPLIPC